MSAIQLGFWLRIVPVCALLLPACSRTAEDHHGDPDDEHGEHAADTQKPASDGIDVPETVRRNLGITFAKVEPRPVAQTIRAPGRFEYLPSARREYRTMMSGRIELLAAQYAEVEAGTPLYHVASPEWHELKEKLSGTESQIREAQARARSIPLLLAAHRKHEESLNTSVALWEKRVQQLSQTQMSGVVSADELTNAQSALATQRAQLAEVFEKEAELEAQRIETEAQLDAALARFQLLLSTAGTLLDLDESRLMAPCALPHITADCMQHHEGPVEQAAPFWRELHEIEVVATAAGTVQRVDPTNGAWASAGSLVMTVVNPAGLRFVAAGMQSDLGRIRDGLPARIVPPKGGTINLQDTMEGTVQLGLGGDADERTVEVLMTPTKLSGWARPGVSAHLEIVTAGGETELAIPLSSVIQDGLSKVIFRRDPKNPDKVMRIEADLGVDDGRWVTVQSGVREGDEVVLDGVYQLMIATSGTVQKGGHFHSDGTFHEGEDH